jgi:hypothetical protein
MDSLDPRPRGPAPTLPPGIDRRGFLRTTAGGAAVLALATLVPTGCAANYPEAGETALLSLSPKEFAVALAAAEALLVGVPVSAERVARRIDHELALAGDPVRSDVKLVLKLLEHLTPLGGRLKRFTALDPAARLRYLHGWRESRFNLRRGAFQAVKAFVYFYAYADDATRSHTGFTGPWPERFKIPATPVDFGEVV